MEKYIMALDSGTTSNRCILFNHKGEICSVAQKEFTQFFPRPGWVEHDAEEIFDTMLFVARQALVNLGAKAENIAAIGITNQRETTICWNRRTGQPVCNAIVWQCRRTAEFCEQLRAEGLTETIRQKTGLVIDPYFSGTKIRWILQNVPGAMDLAHQGDLLFGTVETWLIWKLTGGRVHVTDYSNASRTMLFNIHALSWDKEILDRLAAAWTAGTGRFRRRSFAAGDPRLPAAHPHALQLLLRADGAFVLRRTHHHFRRGGRSAGGAFWTGLLQSRRLQMHLRHRRVFIDEHRDPADFLRQRSGDHHSLGVERSGLLRPGRLYFCGWSRHSVAAGRAAGH